MTDDTLATETWRSVVGFEGLYEVSDLGRVRSLDHVTCNRLGVTRRFRGRILKLTATGHDVAVSLHKNGVQSRGVVHKMVLTAFVGPCPDGMECCHGPSGYADNRLSNLRWDTHSENMIDRSRHGTCHNRNRERCSLSHLLIQPNITNWYAERDLRRCKACHRARANRWYAEKQGYVFDFRAAADRHYAQIMEDESTT